MEEVYEFLKKCGTFYIATEEGNQPRVRPITIDFKGDNNEKISKRI